MLICVPNCLKKIPRDTLTLAVDGVIALIRPADNVYYHELDAKYRTVRRFLPALLEHVRSDRIQTVSQS